MKKLQDVLKNEELRREVSKSVLNAGAVLVEKPLRGATQTCVDSSANANGCG